MLTSTKKYPLNISVQMIEENKFELLYEKLNKREYVHPDPLEFLYSYDDIRDREIVGLISASLAYGRVAQILYSVSSILKKMGPKPSVYLKENSFETMKSSFDGFSHRFATGEKMASFLTGIKTVTQEFGSLEECFNVGLDKTEFTLFSGLSFFADRIRKYSPLCPGHLVPVPGRMSACKRFNLYFRWMIRHDAVDPGGWKSCSPAKLIIPLDVHMHRICLQLGFTKRRSADMKTAMEITRTFKEISPQDPARYDFSLTRLGIRDDLNPDFFLKF
jgi:uncharacterized protein (TIGR02757 family)